MLPRWLEGTDMAEMVAPGFTGLRDVKTSFAQGLMASGEGYSPEDKAKLIAAYGEIIAKMEEYKQKFRSDATGASTAQTKAEYDALVGMADAAGKIMTAQAMSQQARADLMADVVRLHTQHELEVKYRNGDPTVSADYIKTAEGSQQWEPASTGAALTTAIGANGGVQVGADGSPTVSPAALNGMAAAFDSRVQSLVQDAKTRYGSSGDDGTRVPTYINNAEQGAVIAANKMVDAMANLPLTDANGQPIPAEAKRAWAESSRPYWQDRARAAYQPAGGDSALNTSWNEWNTVRQESEKSMQKVEAEAKHYGLDASSWLKPMRSTYATLNDTAGQMTPDVMAENMRGMHVPASLDATEQWANDQLSNLDKPKPSPFAQALDKFSQNPDFVKFAQAYNFPDYTQALIYAAQNPNEFKAAMTVAKTAREAGTPMSAEDLKNAMAGGRKLGQNATTRFQRAIDDIFAPERGTQDVARPEGGPPAPSARTIAERQQALEVQHVQQHMPAEDKKGATPVESPAPTKPTVGAPAPAAAAKAEKPAADFEAPVNPTAQRDAGLPTAGRQAMANAAAFRTPPRA